MERRQERPLQRSFCQTGHSGCRRKRRATSRVLLRSPPACTPDRLRELVASPSR